MFLRIEGIFKKIYYRLTKKKIIFNYKKFCSKRYGHALLYYKINPLIDEISANKYEFHSNNWQVLEIVKILNKLGYWVDIIDRAVDINKLKLKKKYNLFIGIGAGNSGKYYSYIASRLSNSIRIFYAAGPEPKVSNSLIKKRYEYFSRRHKGTSLKLRRNIDKVNINDAMKFTDYIFCIGNKFSINTYKKFKKKIYNINPSTSPDLHFNLNNLNKRDPKKFLYFGGNGNIVKGLDILIEVFAQLKDLKFYICAPYEEDFYMYFKKNLHKCKNIHWLGFTKVTSEKFKELTSECGYIILPSCSEGVATSVATCMRKGLVPIVTYETGIDLDDFGFKITNLNIENLKKKIRSISKISTKELNERSIKSYLSSFKYTQSSFSKSFENAMIDLLYLNKL